MELRHLRYFAAVAETGNLSRAAEKLFIAQPPLSTQIKQFEQELGVSLFTRHPKGVRLTAAGERLLPAARHLLERAAGLRDTARMAGREAREPVGTLTLGYVPSASSTVLPELVRGLRKSNPGVTLQLREMISDEQNDALVAGHIDAGVARTLPRHARVVAACQIPDPFCLAVPRSAPRPRRTLELRDFAEHDFVGFTRHRGPAYFDRSIHLCSRAGFSPRIRYEASTVHGVLDLVSAGLGVALVPASTVLLGVKGVSIHALRRSGVGDVLSLLRRRADANPLLPTLERVVAGILDGVNRRAVAQTAYPAAAPLR